MKLCQNSIIILIALILTRYGNVYGADPPDPEDAKQEESSTSVLLEGTNDEIVVKYTIKVNSHYCIINQKAVVLHYFIEEDNQPLLKYPSELEQIKFNGIELVFDDFIALPTKFAWSLGVLICNHNSPLLLCFFQLREYLFYSLDLNTGKWVNFTMESFSDYEKVNEHGLKYYEIDMSEDVTSFLANIHNECSTAYQELCKCEGSAVNGPTLSSYLEITVKSPKSLLPYRSSNSQPESSHTPVIEPGYSRDDVGHVVSSYVVNLKQSHYSVNNEDSIFYYYTIDKEDQAKFKCPFRIGCIEFNEEVLVFDDSAMLPDHNNWSFDVLTCRHNIPLMVRIHTSLEFTFYSLNTDTGKWSNYIIEELDLSKNVDENGVISYKLNENDDVKVFFYSIYKECLKISEKLCTCDQYTDNNVIVNPTLKIEVKSA